MFDCTGLPIRDCRDDDATGATAHETQDTDRPVDFVVRKDGTPFAILNATPSLALRTVAGFRRTAPEASWTVARL